MDRPQLLASVIRWLRAGYPNGVPSGDYIPLVAILRRQLSDDEVTEVANTLAADAASAAKPEPPSTVITEVPEINRIDVGVEINKVTDELPSESDLARVRAVLVGAGWPFDDEPLRRDDSDHPESSG
ncbi:hypothetical protein GOARA_088_00130 [Gordonia araii NBRC 100433]|uniref:DUF3349 domain-containing protein n=1 Tax=Gordonia araii NBRC 100433 TaxID=1073574 RepID=G7H7C5_9ACTN|nr:DUF3349 domain-containing protein [Gordonia araii]NNG98433.1 DUF3349 domain-containing protein [Gordonia araii NBRC 100433]GAB11750.1 hypothetical protein GOARA_088_00130 [Gordonia araii NBRC 100433]